MKNTFKSKIFEEQIESDIFWAQIDNATEITDTIEKNIDSRFVQFFFCTKGNVMFHFSEFYKRPLTENNGFIVYNSEQNLALRLSVSSKSKLAIAVISIQKLHHFFTHSQQEIPFLSKEKNVKFYESFVLSAQIKSVIHQIEHFSMQESLKKHFLYTKLSELLIYYFSENHNSEETCPYLSNDELMLKLKKAKDIVIENYLNPPDYKMLSEAVEINVHKLKEGFKKVYGNSVAKFILNYKLEMGKKKLEENKWQVKQIAQQLGYENPSHFIEAFKKKYGITPKQFSK